MKFVHRTWIIFHILYNISFWNHTSDFDHIADVYFGDVIWWTKLAVGRFVFPGFVHGSWGVSRIGPIDLISFVFICFFNRICQLFGFENGADPCGVQLSRSIVVFCNLFALVDLFNNLFLGMLCASIIQILQIIHNTHALHNIHINMNNRGRLAARLNLPVVIPICYLKPMVSFLSSCKTQKRDRRFQIKSVPLWSCCRGQKGHRRYLKPTVSFWSPAKLNK